MAGHTKAIGKFPPWQHTKRLLTVPALTLTLALGGLPAVAVSLEPADCPTEAQLQRVLAAFGAKLVPFGTPARATVFAQRDPSGEWTLVLGRPGQTEKRKVTLAGGCDEKASALGAIIERFARPVLVPTRDASPPPIDAGAADAGVAAADAGAPEPQLPPPSPPPIIVYETAPVPDGGVEPAPPPPAPQPERFAVGARGGVGVSTSSFSGVAGLWGEYRWRRFAFGAGVDYYGPMRVSSSFGPLTIEQCRPHFFAKVTALTYVVLEGGVGVSAAWSRATPIANEGDAMYHGTVYLGLHGRVPVGPVELWASLRGWVFVTSGNYEVEEVEVFQFPTFAGDLTLGVALKL